MWSSVLNNDDDDDDDDDDDNDCFKKRFTEDFIVK